jgi:hypothetical protein
MKMVDLHVGKYYALWPDNSFWKMSPYDPVRRIYIIEKDVLSPVDVEDGLKLSSKWVAAAIEINDEWLPEVVPIRNIGDKWETFIERLSIKNYRLYKQSLEHEQANLQREARHNAVIARFKDIGFTVEVVDDEYDDISVRMEIVTAERLLDAIDRVTTEQD